MNEEILTKFIYDVLVGNKPNTQDSFFEIDGDVICSPLIRADNFKILMVDGNYYQVTISFLGH
jgi:phosphatidylserine decarboxylase